MCKKTYSTGYSQAVTHPSTNPAQCCLTSVIRREPVHSAWYGRRTLQHIHRVLLYNRTTSTYAESSLSCSYQEGNTAGILGRSSYARGKGISCTLTVCKKTYSTGYSQAVTHPSTNPAQCCLTSVIRREPVHSAWYGRKTLQCSNKGRLYYTNSHDMKLQQMAECRNNCHNDTGNMDTTDCTSCLLTKHIQH